MTLHRTCPARQYAPPSPPRPPPVPSHGTTQATSAHSLPRTFGPRASIAPGSIAGKSNPSPCPHSLPLQSTTLAIISAVSRRYHRPRRGLASCSRIASRSSSSSSSSAIRPRSPSRSRPPLPPLRPPRAACPPAAGYTCEYWPSARGGVSSEISESLRLSGMSTCHVARRCCCGGRQNAAAAAAAVVTSRAFGSCNSSSALEFSSSSASL